MVWQELQEALREAEFILTLGLLGSADNLTTSSSWLSFGGGGAQQSPLLSCRQFCYLIFRVIYEICSLQHEEHDWQKDGVKGLLKRQMVIALWQKSEGFLRLWGIRCCPRNTLTYSFQEMLSKKINYLLLFLVQCCISYSCFIFSCDHMLYLLSTNEHTCCIHSCRASKLFQRLKVFWLVFKIL